MLSNLNHSADGKSTGGLGGEGVLHVDPESLPVAHAWDPSDLMNGGKWVTIADITDLGHSKREGKKDGQREKFDGRDHVLPESCACDPVLLQQVMKGNVWTSGN